MYKRFKDEIWTLPNILTYIRIIFIPFIVWTYCGLGEYHISAILVALSGLTDCADGYIARHFNMVTDFGKIIDPIADKLTQLTVVACLGTRFPMMFLLVGVLVIKELIVSALGFAVVKATDVVEGSRWYGKLATIVFYLVIILLLTVKSLSDATANLLILCCIGGMILSFVMYIYRYTHILITKKKSKKETKEV